MAISRDEAKKQLINAGQKGYLLKNLSDDEFWKKYITWWLTEQEYGSYADIAKKVGAKEANVQSIADKLVSQGVHDATDYTDYVYKQENKDIVGPLIPPSVEEERKEEKKVEAKEEVDKQLQSRLDKYKYDANTYQIALDLGLIDANTYYEIQQSGVDNVQGIDDIVESVAINIEANHDWDGKSTGYILDEIRVQGIPAELEGYNKVITGYDEATGNPVYEYQLQDTGDDEVTTYPTAGAGNEMFDWGSSTFGEDAWSQLTPIERYNLYTNYQQNQPNMYEVPEAGASEMYDWATTVYTPEQLQSIPPQDLYDQWQAYLDNEYQKKMAAQQYPTTPQPGFLETGYGKTSEWNPVTGQWDIRGMTAEELINPYLYGSPAWAQAPENWWEASELNRQFAQAGQNVGSQYAQTVSEPIANYFKGITPGMYGRDINPTQQYGLAATPTWGNLQNLNERDYTQFQELYEGLGGNWEEMLRKSYEAQPPIARTGLQYGRR